MYKTWELQETHCIHPPFFFHYLFMLQYQVINYRTIKTAELGKIWKWPWSILKYYLDICLKEIRKTTKISVTIVSFLGVPYSVLVFLFI